MKKKTVFLGTVGPRYTHLMQSKQRKNGRAEALTKTFPSAKGPTQHFTCFFWSNNYDRPARQVFSSHYTEKETELKRC